MKSIPSQSNQPWYPWYRDPSKKTEAQKKQSEATEKDWLWIKRMIYLEAKKYTSKETALNIARDVMDYLIAKGVRLDTEKCNNIKEV